MYNVERKISISILILSFNVLVSYLIMYLCDYFKLDSISYYSCFYQGVVNINIYFLFIFIFDIVYLYLLRNYFKSFYSL